MIGMTLNQNMTETLPTWKVNDCGGDGVVFFFNNISAR